jgi:hypothetical protein
MAGIGIRIKWPVTGFKFFKAGMKFKMEKCLQNLTQIPEFFDLSFGQLRILNDHFNNVWFGERDKPIAAGRICHGTLLEVVSKPHLRPNGCVADLR